MGLKIAQVATSGISVRLLLLDHIRALEAEGHEVRAVCAPGPWVESVLRTGVKVETVPMEREVAPLRDLCSLLALRDCFREHRFDVVHTHTPKAGVIGPMAARLAGAPHIVHTINGLLFHDRMSWSRHMLFWLPEKVTATFCDHLLSQSREDMKQAVRGGLCASKKIAYPGNGIDVDYFSPMDSFGQAQALREVGIESGDFVVGSVGRLVKEKGFMELFTAMETLSVRYPQMKLVVIG